MFFFLYFLSRFLPLQYNYICINPSLSLSFFVIVIVCKGIGSNQLLMVGQQKVKKGKYWENFNYYMVWISFLCSNKNEKVCFVSNNSKTKQKTNIYSDFWLYLFLLFNKTKLKRIKCAANNHRNEWRRLEIRVCVFFKLIKFLQKQGSSNSVKLKQINNLKLFLFFLRVVSKDKYILFKNLKLSL